MSKKKAKANLREDAHEIIQEAILEIVFEYQEGIAVERLIKKVTKALPYHIASDKGVLEDYARRIAVDLESTGLVESVPGTSPKELRPRTQGRNALMSAVQRGNYADVKKLVDSEIDLETKNAALISAVINNRIEIVRLLIEAGADVSSRDNLFGRTPLMYASKRTSEKIVQMLKSAGADQ